MFDYREHIVVKNSIDSIGIGVLKAEQAFVGVHAAIIRGNCLMLGDSARNIYSMNYYFCTMAASGTRDDQGHGHSLAVVCCLPSHGGCFFGRWRGRYRSDRCSLVTTR